MSSAGYYVLTCLLVTFTGSAQGPEPLSPKQQPSVSTAGRQNGNLAQGSVNARGESKGAVPMATGQESEEMQFAEERGSKSWC